MAYIMTGELAFHGRPAIYTVTITLKTYDEFIAGLPLPLPDGAKVLSMGEWMETETHTVVTVNYNEESVKVAYADILAAHEGADPYHSYVHVLFEQRLHPSNTKPLFPSEMADDLRRRGMDEIQVQRWLDEEAAYKASLQSE